MKIIAYKCVDTGSIFEDISKYRSHRRKVCTSLKAAEEESKKAAEFKEWLAKEKSKITCVSMIGPWVLENQVKLMEASNFFRCSSFNDQFDINIDRFEKYEITNVVYHDLISNTHSCPENGVTNWGGIDPTSPTGYAGWRCRINGSLIRESKNNSLYPHSGISKFIRLFTGTGGGGNNDWTYDANIFLDDWPGLIQQWVDMKFDHAVASYENEKEAIIRRLSGKY